MLAILWSLIKFFLIFLVIVSLMHGLVTHFILWFELRLKSLQGDLPGKIPFFTILKSFFVEWFCNFSRFFLSAFQFIARKTPQNINHEGLPILLVHGYLQNQSDWLWFKARLLKTPNIGPIYSLNLYSPFDSIAKYAEKLKEEIADIRAETKQDKIILIGHSMGGLVSSYYSEFIAKPGEVAKVITLGSPFQGTRLAALGYGENVKEMSPNSSFLQHLTNRMQHSSIDYHYIASQIDNMIVPWQAAIPANKNPKNQELILEDHGHLRILISPKVVQQVADWVLNRNTASAADAMGIPTR
jgi:predicted alpha/beta hydrolase family esterase